VGLLLISPEGLPGGNVLETVILCMGGSVDVHTHLHMHIL
jgi:hypothetical protein